MGFSIPCGPIQGILDLKLFWAFWLLELTFITTEKQKRLVYRYALAELSIGMLSWIVCWYA